MLLTVPITSYPLDAQSILSKHCVLFTDLVHASRMTPKGTSGDGILKNQSMTEKLKVIDLHKKTG